MRHLKEILESLLDSNFDIADDDVNPLKYFVKKYISKYPRFGHKYIYSRWKMEELEAVLEPYGKKIGTTLQIDRHKFIPDAQSKKQTLVLIAPYYSHPEFYVLVPQGNNQWRLYTCDFDYPEPSMFDGRRLSDQQLICHGLFASDLPSKVYVLRDDSFLKDIQKFLS